MNRRFLLPLLFCALAPLADAQVSSFDLSRYQLPNMKRNTLETDLSAYGGTSEHGYNSFDSENTGTRQNKNGQLYGNIGFSNYRNSTVTQRTFDLSYRLSADRFRYYDDKTLPYTTISDDDKGWGMRHQLSTRLENLRYVRPKVFIETDLTAGFNLNRQKSKQYRQQSESSEIIEDTESKGISGYALVPLKVGLGRIHEVQDARHAVYILDELAKQGRIAKQPTDEEILALAGFISQMKNRRFFDSRQQKIAELEAVDSFLLANNFVSQHDARYFTTLEDFWSYGGRQRRKSGSSISFGLTPGYGVSDYHSETNRAPDMYEPARFSYQDVTEEFRLLYAGVEYQYEKPISLSLQHSIAANVFAGAERGRYFEDKVEWPVATDYYYNVPNIQLQYFQSIGYYPNTRTSLKATGSVQFVETYRGAYSDEDIFEDAGYTFRTGCNIEVNYYFSPKLRMQADARLSYKWFGSLYGTSYGLAYAPGLAAHFYSQSGGYNSGKTEDNGRDFNTTFSLNLIYSIF